MGLVLGQLRPAVRTVPDEESSKKHSQKREIQADQGRHASPVPGGMNVLCRKSDGRTCRLSTRKAAWLLWRLRFNVVQALSHGVGVSV